MTQAFTRRSTAQAVLCALIIFLLAGCAANYARFQMDDQIAQDFQNYKMVDGYRYYYSGRDNKPSAIIGIDPTFEFSSKYWTAIAPSNFKTMVDRMFPSANEMLYGAVMRAPDGKKAGVWYSWVPYHSAKFNGNRITVYSPEEFAEPDGPVLEEKP